jgi:hypothetical protein
MISNWKKRTIPNLFLSMVEKKNKTPFLQGIKVRMFFQLGENAYQFKVVPIKHLGDLREEISRRRKEGIFPEVLDKNYIGKFIYSPPSDFPDALSLIILAAPRPSSQAVSMEGKKPFPLGPRDLFLFGGDPFSDGGVFECLFVFHRPPRRPCLLFLRFPSRIRSLRRKPDCP